MKILRQAALLLCLFVLLVASWIAPLDAPAMRQVDTGLKRALITFASARALNGAISVLQGTQVDAQPGGIGFTFAPGQLLAPANELVKHFSNLMLLASVAFGIQKILIGISAYWVISFVLTTTAIGWAAFYLKKQSPPSWLSKMLVILLMLRFAIPVVVLGSDFLSEKFMQADYAASQKAIDTSADQVDEKAADKAPWWKRITPAMPDLKAKMEGLKNSTEHMVTLMAIFLLQTLVLPLLLLWSLYMVVGSLFGRPWLPPNLKS